MENNRKFIDILEVSEVDTFISRRELSKVGEEMKILVNI
jgi:hypothetical protein